MQHAALVERIENRVHDRRHGADRAELAAALDAEEVGPAGHAFFGERAASSASPMARSVPAILKAPSRYSMSPGAVSSASAASSLPRAMVLRPAATTAEPPTKAEREPTLPTPFARSVSP